MACTPCSKHLRHRWPLAASLLALPFLGGCDLVVLRPSGDVAVQQAHLLIVATLLMLLIIVPVIVLTLLFAWRYRASNKQATYTPDWDHSVPLELVIWAAPLLIIIALGALTWIGTHTLDPYRPIRRVSPERPLATGADRLTIEVVALDWKWLFIYPEQGIASVNEVVAPVDMPIRFEITSSSVMNAFYVPALAGMVYAMPGMQTQLHAVINQPGNYEGFSANFSGPGFSQMRFRFHGVSNDEFKRWVGDMKAGGGSLGRDNYPLLARPSMGDPVRHFGKVDPELFRAIVGRCTEPGSMCRHDMMSSRADITGSKSDMCPAPAATSLRDALAFKD